MKPVHLALPLALLGCTPRAPAPSRPTTSVPTPSTPQAGPATSPTDPAPTPPAPPAPRGDLEAAARASNAFGAELYQHLRGGTDNVAFSPASVTLAFGMTEAGARGDTRAELQRAFRFALPEERLHAALGDLSRRWNRPATETLAIATANRLFGQSGWPFVQDFLALTASAYGAPLEPTDFRANPEAGRQRVNRWVQERTRDRIRDLLPPPAVTTDTRLVLANALYFKATWMDTFNEGATRDADFHVRGGAPVRVPTMHRSGYVRTAARDGYRVVELQYADEGYVMDLVVPDAVDGLPALEARWRAESAEAFFTGLGSDTLVLGLPRFRVETASLRLSDALRAMGVSLAFDRARADFTGIAPFRTPEDRLYVSEAFHKAFVSVDEHGTEAAAATAVVMARAGSAMMQPRPFNVDRPFLFFIRDTHTSAVLFAGRVVDPRA